MWPLRSSEASTTLPVDMLHMYRADMGLEFIAGEEGDDLRLRVTRAIDRELVAHCTCGIYTPKCMQ